MAVGLALAVGLAPAAAARDPVPEGLRSGAGEQRTVSVAEPTGTVSVNPAALEGQPIFVRRTAVTPGMTMVEVSTTPFVAAAPASADHAKVDELHNRPDRPASW